MQWKNRLLPALLAAGMAVAGLSSPAAADPRHGDRGGGNSGAADRGGPDMDRFQPRRFEQDAARRDMLDGSIMPFSVIKQRTEREMDGASYLGSEYDGRRGEYRLKYMMDGRVLWVDVDGRSGDIVRRSR